MDAVAGNADVASAPVAAFHHHDDDDDDGDEKDDGHCGRLAAWPAAAACSLDNDSLPRDDSVGRRVNASCCRDDAWSDVAHSSSPRAVIHPQSRDHRT